MPLIRYSTAVQSTAVKLGMVADAYVSNALIHLYSTFGELDCARLVFNEMSVRDLVTWNSLICGLSQKGALREVLAVFDSMRAAEVRADAVTMVKVVLACSLLGEWQLVESMVAYIEENGIEMDVYLGNTLVDCYGRRGLTELAERVFKGMKVRNIVTFNVMIMVYAKAGNLAAAREVFEEMSERDVISWSSMITGYSQANRFSDTLLLFREMQRANVRPDEIVLVSVLSACARRGALGLGRWIHDYIKKNDVRADVYVGNSLIDMYAKCGCVDEAMGVFKEMKEKDTLSWNLIILGLANNGYVESALEVFSRMLMEGFAPNDVTFLGVLIACAHNGLVEKGLRVFESMNEVHRVEPMMKHFGCVVDLLGRAGELEKAHKFIIEMPVKPDQGVWRIMLGACKMHGNVVLAEIATRELVEMDRRDSGNYVLLSNTYAGANRWNEAMEVREMMIDTVQKPPGSSSIEVSCTADEFRDAEIPPRKNQLAFA